MEHTHFCDAFNGTSDGQNPLMNTWDDLGDTCFNAGLLAQVCDIFASFSDDYTCVFCADEGAKG